MAEKRKHGDDRFLDNHFSSGGNLGVSRASASVKGAGPESLKHIVLGILQKGETVARWSPDVIRSSPASLYASADRTTFMSMFFVAEHSKGSGQPPSRREATKSGARLEGRTDRDCKMPKLLPTLSCRNSEVSLAVRVVQALLDASCGMVSLLA